MRELCKIGKQSKDVVHCDKAHSLAQSCEERGTAQLHLIFYLREWNEAKGVLRSIDLEDGNLVFEGFTVRVSPSLSAPLSCLHDLIGQEVSIIRTDSIRHPLVVRVMQSGSQECLSDGVGHEPHSDTRCLETINVAGVVGVARDSIGSRAHKNGVIKNGENRE